MVCTSVNNCKRRRKRKRKRTGAGKEGVGPRDREEGKGVEEEIMIEMRPTKPKTFAIWFFTEKACSHLKFRDHMAHITHEEMAASGNKITYPSSYVEYGLVLAIPIDK